MSEPVMRIEEFDVGPAFTATVVSNTRITPGASPEDVRELVLDVDREDFPYLPGQSVGVRVPGNGEFGAKRHFRLYSVADLPERGEAGLPRIKLCVRRCDYIDPYNGEWYPGICSNYLCDLAPGASLSLTGPVGLPFGVPEDRDANLILIGAGTGIAPFRALVRHIYEHVDDWSGRVWLFHGARSGLELLYMNQQRDDFARYYDEETFEAFRALSPRPNWADPIAWDHALAERGDELWRMLGEPKTHVYVAGLEAIRDQLDRVLGEIAGSPTKWARRKAELQAGGRWVELLY